MSREPPTISTDLGRAMDAQVRAAGGPWPQGAGEVTDYFMTRERALLNAYDRGLTRGMMWGIVWGALIVLAVEVFIVKYVVIW